MNTFSLSRWFRNVSIAKKLYFTVGIMALLIGLELFVLFFCLNTLSSLRAYVGGEGLWSKAQKDAVFHLYKYGVAHNPDDYLLFLDFMKIPIGDGKSRRELLKEQPDIQIARQGFLEGRNHPDDIDGMIHLFRHFSGVSYIERAITIWGEAEPAAIELLTIAEHLHDEINAVSPSADRIQQLLASIHPINERLTALEDAFSYTLGEGSRWLEGVVLKLLFLVALTVEVTGLLLAISVSRSIQRGLGEIISVARSFAMGNYDDRTRVFSSDEIGVVANSFNRMADELQRNLLRLEKAQLKFQTLLQSAPDPMVITDGEGKIKLVNVQTERVFGYDKGELLEQPVARLIRGRNMASLPVSTRPFFGQGDGLLPSTQDDLYCTKKNGEAFPVEISISPLKTEEGVLILAAIRDISERKQMLSQRMRAEEALRAAYGELQVRVDELAEANQQLRHEIGERHRAEAELRRAFAILDQHVDNTPLGVIEWEQVAGMGGPPRVQRWSGQAETIFGWTESEALHRSASELGLIHEGDADRAADSARDLTQSRRSRNSIKLRCYTKQRQVRHCQWYNSALHAKDVGRITILSLVEDITERVNALDDVFHLAHHDILTGLPNRVMLQDRLRQALAGAQRRGKGVAVMMLDLDHFKNVNDALGHSVGDMLLQEVAVRLSAHLRAVDTVARIGGDEFVLIQPDLIDRGGASILAQKLTGALANPFLIQGHRLDIRTSIGIALCPDDGADPDLLLRNADMALYRAKRDGRSQYRFYSADMDLELKATRSLENGLRRAIEASGLELFYQPTFSLTDGRLRGMEVLLRWPHPGGGYVAPASFIPIAELSGLIIPLGEWTLRRACRQARAWIDAGRRFRIAVNVSATQLRQPDFAALLAGILAETGLVASALELEITESVFLDASKTAITKTLHEVAEMGIHLAIDDFGAGYSSLGYLKHFPFNRVKIDAAFVRDIGLEANADAIVKAIIALGRNLGKSVTAEGVETELQVAFLSRHKCDEGQGYLLARPAPAIEAERAFTSDAALRHKLIG